MQQSPSPTPDSGPARPTRRPFSLHVARRVQPGFRRFRDLATTRTDIRIATAEPVEVAGPDAGREGWSSFGPQREVLFGVHTVTSLARLEDLSPLVEQDPRVQLIYTAVPDLLGHGVPEALRELDVLTIPWEEAVTRDFDLAVSSSLHRMEDIRASRRFAAPHGAGYNKLWPAWSPMCAGGERQVYGLDSWSLLDEIGNPIFDTVVLPHYDHLTTLTKQCPQAVPYALVGGDPCHDRLLHCLDKRDWYRSELGVRPGQVLVAVASTWGDRSLVSQHLDYLTRLPTELPADHRVIATVHPGVWAKHGTRAVRGWLRRMRDVGVDLVDAREDWRGLIAAADVVMADHSSLGVYAAGVGRPLILSHYAAGEVDPGSVLADLARRSPVLDPTRPLLGQLEEARKAQPAQWEVAQRRLASLPGLSAQVIRQAFYRLLELPEPAAGAEWPSVPAPRLVVDPT
jgi:hypothetical protein